MAISVVGFDIGSLTSYVAVARGGGIETVTNEYSDRQTPTCVAFTERKRLIGTSAKLQHVTNIKNTFINFVPLIGKRFTDPAISREQQYLPYKIEPSPEGRVLIKVKLAEGTCSFTPEQLVAMQLTKLKEVAEKELSSKVVDVVINVPTYYTDAERRAMIDAAKIARLNCVKLVNDTTAIGTAYGLYNKELPALDAPPRNVVFVSVGYVSTQVALCAFNAGKMEVLCTVSDWQLGGRDLDNVIFQKLANEFQAKHGKRIADNTKATIRLLQECEKVKKAMSANSQELPVNVECVMDEKDLTCRVKRADFEDWAKELLDRFTMVLQRFLSVSKLDVKNIHSVELVGGSSRVPAFKAIVASVFKQEGRTSLNADEAVARGCALQAAICSPVFKVREFKVTDACPYAISVHCEQDPGSNEPGKVGANETLEAFPLFHPIPSSRRLHFDRHGSLFLEARYSDPASLPNQNVSLGLFRVTDPSHNPHENCKFRVKARVDSHGLFSVSQVEVAEEYEKEVEEVVEEPKDVKPAPENAKVNEGQPMDVEVTPDNGDGINATSPASPVDNKNDSAAPDGAVPKKPLSKKKFIKYKPLSVESSLFQFSNTQLDEFCEVEGKLFEQDELEHHRTNAKNAVEEYVYEMRNKIQDSLGQFASPAEQQKLLDALQEAEDWLYGDGEDLQRQVYVDRLNQMKLLGDPIVMRWTEKHDRASAVKNFEHSIVHIRKIIDSINAGQPEYNHLTPDQVNQLQTSLSQYEGWLRSRIHAQDARPLTEDPIVKSAEIVSQQKAMEAVCHPIINTPKPAPAPPTPPAPPAAAAAEQDVGNGTNNENNAEAETTEPTGKHHVNASSTKAQNNCTSKEMDVD